QVHHGATKPDQLVAHLGRRVTDAGADLDHRLVQLGLDLAEYHRILLEDLGDVALELPGLGIDDLVLLLDPDGERGCLHRGSTTNVGTVDPPPAVTLTRVEVLIRVRVPSTRAPCQQNGAVSTIRSSRRSRPSTSDGNGSLGSAMRRCTT